MMGNFACLAAIHQSWHDIVVIDRTFEREGKKYYILGMTLAEEAKLYVIEPNHESTPSDVTVIKRSRTYRSQLKASREFRSRYLSCSEVHFGDQKIKVRGGQSGCLQNDANNYRLQLFFDMMSAGWQVPAWLQEEDWKNLLLVELELAEVKRLPKYTPNMPIAFKHRPHHIEHFVEKAVTLTVGKGRTLSFIDHCGDKVWCYINNVELMDVWSDMEKQFSAPRYTERFLPEQIEEIKAQSQQALAQNCPKGMYHISIEYECSKDIALVFYTKDYLNTDPWSHSGNGFLLVIDKPDKATGAHNLPLKSATIATPVTPDTVKISAELFNYSEAVPEWEETI